MTSIERQAKYRQTQIDKGRTKAIVYLTEDEQDFLKFFGQGNLSDGIRNVVSMARTVNKE